MGAAGRRWAGALLLAAATACTSAFPPNAGDQPPSTSSPTIVIVTRHAERVSETDRDSPLSEVGRERALALAEALAESGVTAIYATQYRRTHETAAPLASGLGVAIRTDTTRAAGASAAALARRILTEHRGQTVLVVGHSNTVPAIVGALGGPAFPELESSRYGDLFVLVVHSDRGARTIRTRYGR